LVRVLIAVTLPCLEITQDVGPTGESMAIYNCGRLIAGDVFSEVSQFWPHINMWCDVQIRR
jgi:hypothetical protein